ncbi:MAG: InlB B-repeat-containing protein, partial [Oscillospiraceae bacterium]|nr:InlB B-repeat-containing protein [Oscillospiraceae bacterium]
LNLEFDLRELTVFDLKQLLTISALIDEGFPYNTEELRAVYEEKGGDEAITPPPQTETEPPVVTEPTDSISEQPVQTAEPIDTTPPPTQTTLPNQTTARPWSQASTAATTTQPPVITTDEENTDLLQPDDDDPSQNGTMHYVTIIINGAETLQEVVHGGNAIKPADPVIDGLTFAGWDKSFENITQDTIITALFKETSGSATTHTVTVVINGRSDTIIVEHGQSANLPTTLNVEGYIFKGWDKDFTNITQDVTITAILEPQTQAHTVTFVINGQSYPVQVEHGGTAVPPYIPDKSTGFIGWDKTVNNITADVTITAVFSVPVSHTVTFMIDGRSYPVTVEDGATVEPPFNPTTDASGRNFIGWDRGTLSNITSDTIITAIFN